MSFLFCFKTKKYLEEKQIYPEKNYKSDAFNLLDNEGSLAVSGALKFDIPTEGKRGDEEWSAINSLFDQTQ